MKMKIFAYDIDYNISEEDLENAFPDDYNSMDCDFDDLLNNLLDILDHELTFTIEVEEDASGEDIDDVVVDTVSDITGFLIDGLSYNILD